MNKKNVVAVEWILKALTAGRPSEKLEAQRTLEDATADFDRALCRDQLLRLVKGDFRPKSDPVADAEISGTRCWLLSALGRLPADGLEPEATLQQHLDPTFESGKRAYWCRYWALEGLLHRRSANLAQLCGPVAAKDSDVL